MRNDLDVLGGYRAVILTAIFLFLAGCTVSHEPVSTKGAGAEHAGELARGVFRETNRLRANPADYAAVLESILDRISGSIYYPLNSEVGVRMREGAPVVREAIAAIKRESPLSQLTWSEPLTRVARAHVLDTGPKGIVSHASSSGESLGERLSGVMEQEGFTTVAENISYGYDDARDVVAQLFIDDGVPGRGHRKNLLKPKLNYTGVACGEHKRYRQMCVAIYAYRSE